MLLAVEHIQKFYHYRSFFSHKYQHLILDDVSFQIRKGQSIGLVGASGSGKSTLAHIIAGIEKPDKGRIYLNAHPIAPKHAINIVFQDYMTSMNPTMNVMQIMAEALKLNSDLPHYRIKQDILNLLQRVGLSKYFMYRYLHELSGGEAQRVCIGRALANFPILLILDEPISSLDIPNQVQLLDLFKTLQTELQLSYLFITHDIKTLCYFCDEVLFLHDKKIVETCLISNLPFVQHPYAQSLVKAMI